MLIKVKMPTIIGILTFMSRINFVLSWVEHEFFYNLRGQVSMLFEIVLKLDNTDKKVTRKRSGPELSF